MSSKFKDKMQKVIEVNLNKEPFNSFHSFSSLMKMTKVCEKLDNLISAFIQQRMAPKIKSMLFL